MAGDDNSEPTDERRKLVNPSKMCPFKNGLWMLKYAGRLTQNR